MIKSLAHPDYLALTKWLKNSRKQKGLTLRDVAERIDEPFQTVSKIEKAQRNLTILEYVEYCKAIDVDPAIGLDLIIKLSSKKKYR
jgi:transcriptional regulator with XRE-family HTH domain